MKLIGMIDVYGEAVKLFWDGVSVWAAKEECGDCSTFSEAVEYCVKSWEDDEWDLQFTKEAARTLD